MTKQIPRGYKQTKLGVIPEDWEVVKLGKIAKFIGGGTPSTKHVDFWSGHIPWISSSDLIENDIRYINTTRFITTEAINNSATKIIPENSVLIVSRVGVGKIAVNKQALCTSQDFQSAILENDNSYFFAYLLQLKTKKLIELNQGTSIKGLVKDDLSSLVVNRPPLKEQEKIAEILSTWDEAITKQEQLIKQKQVFKKGVMQQIFSQKIRFKDCNGNDYPTWQNSTLEKIAIFSKGKSISKSDISAEGTIKCIRYGELYTRYREVVKKVFSKTNIDKQQLVFSDINDVIMPASGETASDIATASCILESGIAIGGDINIIRSKLNGIFLSYYLNLIKKCEIASLSQGNSVVHLYATQLKQIQISFPTNMEQDKIADFLIEIDDEISKQTEQLNQLNLQKQSLMQKLLTGQVRALK